MNLEKLAEIGILLCFALITALLFALTLNT